MKKLIFTGYFCAVFSFNVLGQSRTTYTDPYGRIIGKSETQPIETNKYVDTFVPMDLSSMRNAIERRQAAYDQNKKYFPLIFM